MIAREFPTVRFGHSLNRHAHRAQIKDICTPPGGGMRDWCASIWPSFAELIESPSVAAFSFNREGVANFRLDKIKVSRLCATLGVC